MVQAVDLDAAWIIHLSRRDLLHFVHPWICAVICLALKYSLVLFTLGSCAGLLLSMWFQISRKAGDTFCIVFVAEFAERLGSGYSLMLIRHKLAQGLESSLGQGPSTLSGDHLAICSSLVMWSRTCSLGGTKMYVAVEVCLNL